MKTFRLRSTALICATLLSACGSSDSDESTTATTAGGAATDQVTTTTAAANVNKAALSCADVPASLVNSVLGTTVKDPTSTTTEIGAIQCSYESQSQLDADGKGLAGQQLDPTQDVEQLLGVTITLDNAATAASFKTNMTNAEGLGGATPVSGLGDEAVLLKLLEAPGYPTLNTLYAREGNRAVSVISVATVEQQTELLKQLLAK